MFRSLILVFFALLAAPLVSAQSQVEYIGSNRYPPANIDAIQKALPNAQVSSIQSQPGYGDQVQSQPALMPPSSMPGMETEMTPPESDNPNEGKKMPQTAAEIAQAQQDAWEAGAASQQVRQRGLAVGQGDVMSWSISSSKVSADQAVLSRWKQWLPQFGVDPAKITYESRRLSRKDFDMWASRFVWLACYENEAPIGCASLKNSK